MAKAAVNKYQAKPYKGRPRKESLIAEFTEKVEKSKGMVFTNYQGLTHHQLEALKKAAKSLNADFVITKNRLLLRSLESAKLSDEDKNKFQQPTAALFMYDDVVEPLKQLAKTIKELNLPTIKFGIIDGAIVSDADVVKLSTLPPKDTLRAQLLGQMMSPVQGLHRALSWNMQSLVMTLNAIAQNKPATPTAPAAPTSAEIATPNTAEPATSELTVKEAETAEVTPEAATPEVTSEETKSEPTTDTNSEN